MRNLSSGGFIKLFLSIGMCLVTGFIGSFFTLSSIPNWYTTLHKPFFSPPNWVFGPVWTLLYILMGVSFYLVWISKSKRSYKQKAKKTFFIQLSLNLLWSLVFFGLRNLGFALVDIIILWIAIIMTVKYFYPISKTAAYLLVPYLLWVSFASILNLFIVILN